ncbi:major facilitator superfamily domain-containing protein [Syncephalis plumigaleata]|nr:major facilitator superfamily domain-containing protein [Syncephalis plumigaleata]
MSETTSTRPELTIDNTTNTTASQRNKDSCVTTLDGTNEHHRISTELPVNMGRSTSNNNSIEEEAREDSIDMMKSTMEELPLRRRLIVFLGLALAIFLGSLDQTIVSTAIPRIASEFNALDQVAWIGIAYMLTSTAAQPLYGRFSDIFGRKPMFLAATVIFLAGSLGCGASNSIIMLIIMRAIAGIGGGGFVPLVMIIIAGQYAGIVGAVFAFSSVIGPLLGGLFTDHLSWRWAFYINLPVGAITILIILFLLHLKSPVGSIREKLKRIDYLGTLLVLVFCVTLLLPVNWGGAIYPWTSPIIISLFCVAIVIFAVLLWVESRIAAEPIVPLGSFLLGWGFFSPVYYLPVFFQAVRGYTATQSGLILLPFVLPVSITAIISGTVASRLGNWSYRTFMGVGMAIATVGYGLVTLFDVNTQRALEICAMIILGVGFGGAIQNCTLSAQLSVAPDDMAIATALISFFQIIGGVIGLAVEGSVFNNQLSSLLQQYFADGSVTQEAVQSIAVLRGLAEPLRDVVVKAYVEALRMQYYVLIPVAAISALAFILVKVLPQQANDTNERRQTPMVAMH